MSTLTLDEKDLEYLASFNRAVEAGFEAHVPWLTKLCQECGVGALESGYPHIVDRDGHVLICCEGYHQVNPNTIGLLDEQWMDWHEEIGGLEPPLPDELEHLAVECEYCHRTRAQCTIQGPGAERCCERCTH